MSQTSPIIYTITDEAPALATQSLLPIFRAFLKTGGIPVETRDISLASRVLAAFRDKLPEDKQVHDALAELGEMPRASFLLRTLMGLSYKEISELLDIPEGTAMSHVHRSRATLRTLLEADVSFELCTNWRAS